MNSNISELLEEITRTLGHSTAAELSQLEFDLLKQQIRDLYEQLDNARNYVAAAPVQHRLKVHTRETPQLEEEPVVVSNIPEIPVREEVKEEVKEVVEKQIPIAKTEAPLIKKEPTAKTEKAVSINEMIKTPESLNQKLKATGNEVHRKLSSKHLKDLVDLNKRFVFVNELFNGNTDAFYKAVQHIDAAGDFTLANDYIKTELAPNYKWDESSGPAQSFVKLVKQKFGVE